MARRVRVRLETRFLAHLLVTAMPGVWWRTGRGVPPDANLLGCAHDVERDCIWVYFEHESFAEVADGQILPIFDAFDVGAIHFSNPATPDDITSLNGLTAKQVERWQADNPEPTATVGG
jgi:hypothetical protein